MRNLIGGEIAYFNCDEGSGGILYDSVGGFRGNKNTSEVTWIPKPGTTKFKNPFYLWFPPGGVRKRAVVPQPVLTPAQTSTAWSATAWVLPIDDGSNGPNWSIMSATLNANTLGNWSLRLNSNRQFEFFCNHLGNAFVTVPEPFPYSQWSHVGCTFDGTTLRLYIDGAEAVSAAQTLTPNVPPQFWVGDRGSSSWSSWSGGLDEIRVFGSTLTPAEVAMLAAGGPSSAAARRRLAAHRDMQRGGSWL